MKKDVVINGISINELKKTKAAIQQGAAVVIADSITEVNRLVALIITADKDEAEKLSEEALEILETVDVVSGVSGVTYFLNYQESNGGGYDESEILSCQLETKMDELIEAADIGTDWNVKNAYMRELNIRKLQCKLDSMESESCAWHSSTC